jgi:hypothetical protein
MWLREGHRLRLRYTYDADKDGASLGMIGARVCTSRSELLKFHCWYWAGDDGPNDFDPGISTTRR